MNNIVEKLEVLLDLAVRLAEQGVVYLERENGHAGAVAEAPKKEKAARAPKAEKAAESAPAAPAAAHNARAVTHEEALEVGKIFVKRFNKTDAKEGLAQAREILVQSFKVNQIGELNDAQRIQFVSILNGKIAAANNGAGAATEAKKEAVGIGLD